MSDAERLIHAFTTNHGDYEIVEMDYDDRPARVLFSGSHRAAQSGIALDEKVELLFDYNQRFIELIECIKPKCILIIGGGGFTLPSKIIQRFKRTKVDVVELDGDLEAVAEKYFDLVKSKRLNVYAHEGRAWLEAQDMRYDLIIVDVFEGSETPRSLITVEAVRLLKDHLNISGTVAINSISSYYGRNNDAVAVLYAAYRAVFNSVAVYPASKSLLSYWLQQNFVMVAQSGDPKLINLRYDELEPPDPPHDPLYD